MEKSSETPSLHICSHQFPYLPKKLATNSYHLPTNNVNTYYLQVNVK